MQDTPKKRVKTIRAIKLLIIFALFSLVYIYNFDGLVKDFENTATSRQSDIDKDIQTTVNFIDSLTIFGNNYFKENSGEDVSQSELHHLLEYRSDLNQYNLDNAKDISSESLIGNLTGLGAIPTGGIELKNIDLALDYYDFWSKFYDRFPEIAWIYYTGANDFISMFPWVSSEEFSYDPALKNVPFYTVAAPENNMSRDAAWTPVYLDKAGKGLMVTLSSPIYNGDDFMGVVSVDITTSKLSELLECHYKTYLVDNTDSIIATSEEIDFSDEAGKFTKMLQNTRIEPLELRSVKANSVQRLNGYYVYVSTFINTPWKMVMLEPAPEVALEALGRSIPVILICILLIFTMYEAEKRRKAEMILLEITNTDQLTGIKSRRYLEQKVEEEGRRADRYQKNLTLILMDLDRFKSINDKWGHPVGDDVLRHVSKLTQDAIRDTDILARIGGEEFAILLPETDRNGGSILAERIREILDRSVHKTSGNVTASFGVAERERGETFDNWYKRADHMLYLAKEKGRNRVVSSEE